MIDNDIVAVGNKYDDDDEDFQYRIFDFVF